MIRTLLFSTLFPSSARPHHGTFVETRLRKLLESNTVAARVVAPVPWFPSRNPRFGEYAQFAATPLAETRHGIDIEHPRYLLPPKIGMTAAPLLLALGARAKIRDLVNTGFDFDLIDAHYYYPDGVAAVLLGKWFKKPVVITSRGSDLNVLADFHWPRQWIRWAWTRAARSVFVSGALSEKMAGIVGDGRKSIVIRNGVDLQDFPFCDREESKARLGLDSGRWLLFAGRLTRPKGVYEALQTVAALPEEYRLAYVGEGVEADGLARAAQDAGIAHRVLIAGARPQKELATWYSAASVLILPSRSEGVPNVILEALACGTPVVATAVGGIPEVMTSKEAGMLVNSFDVAELVAAVEAVVRSGHDRRSVRKFAQQFSWSETTARQLDVFHDALQESVCET